jgi:hypothetical protein
MRRAAKEGYRFGMLPRLGFARGQIDRCLLGDSGFDAAG